MVLLSATVLASSQGAFGQDLVDGPTLRAGDLDAVAAHWWETMLANPDTLETQFRLFAWDEAVGDRPGFARGSQDWRTLLDSLAAESGWSLRRVRGQLAQQLRVEGAPAESLAELRLDAGSPRRWLTIGPFGQEAATGLFRSYPPETEFDANATYSTRHRELRWREIRSQEHDTRVDLNYGAGSGAWRRGGGIHYLRTRFAFAEEFLGLFVVGGDASLRVWMDGVEICTRDGFRSRLQAVSLTGIRCAPGEHTLLIKSDGSPFSLAFRYANGVAGPIEPISLGSSQLSDSGVVLAPELMPRGSAYHEWRSLWADSQLPVDLWLPLAVLSTQMDDTNLAREILTKWDEESHDVVPLAMVATQLASRFSDLPADWVDNWLGGLWRRAFERDTTLVPLQIAEARRLFSEDRAEEAAMILGDVLSREPRSLPALLLLEEIAKERNWLLERIRTLERLRVVAPSHPQTIARWIRRWESDERSDLALPLWEELCAVQPSTWNVRSLANALRRAGRSAAAMHQLDRLESLAGTPLDALGYRLEALERWGEVALARATLDRIIELRPDDSQTHVTAGELAWRAGDLQEALHHHRRALSLEPGQVAVCARLERLERLVSPAPEPAPFWAPYALRYEDVVAGAPSRERYPRAASVYLLDQMVTWADERRGVEEMIHQIIRVDSTEAVQRYSDFEVPGEVLELRVITAAGEELHPTAGGGRGTFTLPGLSPGAIIEYRCVIRRNLPVPDEFETGPFYFQDPDFASAFHFSQWIVLHSNTLLPTIEERNLPFERQEEAHGRLRALTWTAREMDRPEPEPLAPPADRVLPNVRLTAKLDWRQALEAIGPVFAPGDAPTPELRRAIDPLLAGVSSRREQVEKLYAACCERITSHGAGSNATEVWLTRSGDRGLLLAGMLRAAGIPFDEVLVAPRDELTPFADWSRPNANAFAYPLLRVELPGEDPLYLSGSFRLAAPGRIPRVFQGSRAVVVSPSGGRWTSTPGGSLVDEARSCETNLAIQRDGTVVIRGSMEDRPLQSADLRDNLKDLPAAQQDLGIQNFVGRLVPGATETRGRFPNLPSVGVPFRIEFETESSRLLQSTTDGHLLRTVFYPSQLRAQFGQGAKRRQPLVSPTESLTIERTTVELGKSHAVARLPEDLELAGTWGSYRLQFGHEEGRLTMERRLELRPFVMSPDEARVLHEVCSKIDRKEDERVVLRRLE